MSAEITLRDAAPADAPAAARLIHAAGSALYNRLFGPTPEDATRFFQTLFSLSESLFSYQNALVAVQEGEVVGLALSIRAADYHRGLDLPRQVLRRGLPFLFRLLAAALDLRHSTLTPPPESYYLGILSVSANCRGEGIGARLLAEVHERAQVTGCACVCLHAERDNEGARRFYERHGYQVTHDRATPSAARWGVTGFVGMQRELP